MALALALPVPILIEKQAEERRQVHYHERKHP